MVTTAIKIGWIKCQCYNFTSEALVAFTVEMCHPQIIPVTNWLPFSGFALRHTLFLRTSHCGTEILSIYDTYILFLSTFCWNSSGEWLWASDSHLSVGRAFGLINYSQKARWLMYQDPQFYICHLSVNSLVWRWWDVDNVCPSGWWCY